MVDISSLNGTASSYALGDTTANSNGTDLGQQDFLTLMTAQLQNQDPFAPMENGEFLAQMAQFSTVAGLDSVNEALGQISNQIASSQISTASGLLGKQVLIPGTVARPGADGAIRGAVELSQAAGSVTVVYTDADTGAELTRQDLGAQPAGLMEYAWTDLPATLPRDDLRVRVSVLTDSTAAPTPYVYATVEGVQLPQGGQDMALLVQDYGLQSYLEIAAIR